MSIAYDVVGVGNAIVDVIASVEDTFLTDNAVAKGAMTLVDEERSADLYDAAPPAREASGGSGANTVAGVASFGGRAAYFGKVADDQLGAVFTHDIRAGGVHFETAPLSGGPATARCLIFVTPDAQRSMNTFLGASTLFGEDDLDEGVIASGAITYLEGYLFDRPDAKRAFERAADIARAAGRKVALTLSDSFCVDRHRESFLDLVRERVDILFANETEAVSLFQSADFHAAAQALAETGTLAFVTRSELGSVVVDGDARHAVDAEPVANAVLDTTGAGDQYAAGALYGLAQGRTPAEAGRLGSLAAAEVIAHYGARPEQSLRDLAAHAGAL